MKNICKLLALLLILCTVFGCFVACGGAGNDTTTDSTVDQRPEWVDYVSQVKLNMNSPTAKVEIPASDIKQFIDGDTTHFNVPTNISKTGILKARYLAINTPESTGQIEEWGKKASNFTKEKLKSAVSIVIESDTATWNYDSTGDRLLVWVWYKTSENSDYINLNLQILQEGLAIASNSAQNKYGDYCMKAIDQAKAYKLYVYSGEKDPDYYYGEAIELTIRELRVNPEKYVGKTVAFEGIISKNSGDNGIYVEAIDEETQMLNGIFVYYGFNLTGGGLSVIKPGNKVRIVGSMQFYEAGGTYQVSDLHYDMMDPKNPNNIQKLGDGFSGAYPEVAPATFATGKVSITVVENDVEKTVEAPYAQMALATTISMKDLKVDSIYTTHNGGDSDGAMTLTCSADGVKITVRTVVLLDENNKVVTKDIFQGKTIDVRGTVDYFNGDYQIKVTSLGDIVIH